MCTIYADLTVFYPVAFYQENGSQPLTAAVRENGLALEISIRRFMCMLHTLTSFGRHTAAYPPSDFTALPVLASYYFQATFQVGS